MKKKSVLVIILNYQGQAVLLPCLRSVLAELGPEDLCLVIDNGGEETLLKKVQATFPAVRILRTGKNLGFAKGMNKGLALAKEEGFEAAWILNNDAVVVPHSLEALKQAARLHPGENLFSPVIVTPHECMWFAGGRINFWRMRTEHLLTPPQHTLPFETNFLTGCALFIPERTLETVGFFDERYFLYYEDAEYSLRTISRGGKLFVVPQAKVVHQEVSEANPEKVYWLVRSGVEFFSRHTPRSLRGWMKGYLFLRQSKNWLETVLFKRPLAHSIKRAYTDASTK